MAASPQRGEAWGWLVGAITFLTVNRSALFAAALSALALTGCGKPATTDKAATAAEVSKTDPWEQVARQLRRDNDLAACKVALGQLNNDLAERTDVPVAAPISDSAAKSLQAIVPLSKDDLAEVRAGSYSGLDSVYLADCFYLRDSAQSLDASALPPAEQARLAFAWTCRQLVLEPWTSGGLVIPAIPTTYALQRGSGSGLERAYVFLALLQQMGIDGCLIGPPGSDAKTTATIGADGKPLANQNGPFWAVGARIGKDILLFEPWRGEPFPGPAGKGIGILAQIKSDPNQLKAWIDDKSDPWKVALDDVKQATVVLAVPLSSLSPRMALLEQKIRGETGVRLAMAPAELQARFASAAPDGPGLANVKFWNPPTDRSTYTRVLSTFLPPEEGGRDVDDPTQQILNMYRSSLLPTNMPRLPEGLHPSAVQRIALAIVNQYVAAFFTAPSPRERIQRGQFQDAARDLTNKRQEFGRGQERLQKVDLGELAAWTKAAAEVYDNLEASRYPNKGQLTPQPDSDPEVANARALVDEFWRKQGGTARLILDRSAAAVSFGEASYLLALVKHEQAERKQERAEYAGSGESQRAREAAADAWREAINAWSAFLEQDTAPKSPRTRQAKRLAARAERLVEVK
ncbi:MAG TPA: hypothetical protein VN641_07955 [Urbifossiella sp.]|nr:hypothetical protein [Urbifossiella sp.]